MFLLLRPVQCAASIASLYHYGATLVSTGTVLMSYLEIIFSHTKAFKYSQPLPFPLKCIQLSIDLIQDSKSDMPGLSNVAYDIHQRLFKTEVCLYYTHGLVWFCTCPSDIPLKLCTLLHVIAWIKYMRWNTTVESWQFMLFFTAYRKRIYVALLASDIKGVITS